MSYLNLPNLMSMDGMFTYSLTLNPNGGEINGSTDSYVQEKNSDDTFDSFDAPWDIAPTRPGYEFKGWAYTSDSTTADYGWEPLTVDPNHPDRTLYAVWQETDDPQPPRDFHTFSLNLNANGGTFGDGDLLFYDSENTDAASYTFKKLPNEGDSSIPTRPGYKFAGWNSESDGSGVQYPQYGGVITADVNSRMDYTLYAQWVKEPEPPAHLFTYTLTLDANGGSIDGHESPWVVESVNTDDTSHVFNGIPSVGMNRDGYTFKGWSLDPHATTPTYDPGYVIGANSDKTAYTLYAVWQKDEEPQPPATQFTYSLTLDANGGAFDGHENPWVVQSVDTDDTSFIFDGIPSDVPTRDGYTFKGWNSESDGSGVEYEAGYPIGTNSDKTAYTLYAQWQKNEDPQPPATLHTYSLTLDANGGAFNGHENPWLFQSVDTDDSALQLNAIPSGADAPTRDGYKLVGWNTKADGTGDQHEAGDILTATPDQPAYTLYAQWQEDETPQPPAETHNFSLTLDANGGAFDGHENPWVVQSVDTTDTTFIFDGIPSDVPTRDGYTFKGWTSTPDGTTVDYDAGYKIGANTGKTQYTLYALWQKNNETPVNPTDPTKPTDPTQPTEPTNPTEPTTPATPQEPAADETEGSVDEVADADNEAEGDEESDQNALAETSDPMSAAPIAGIALASGAALIAARKKLNGRHNN